VNRVGRKLRGKEEEITGKENNWRKIKGQGKKRKV
jgi:hypothetical protein